MPSHLLSISSKKDIKGNIVYISVMRHYLLRQHERSISFQTILFAFINEHTLTRRHAHTHYFWSHPLPPHIHSQTHPHLHSQHPSLFHFYCCTNQHTHTLSSSFCLTLSLSHAHINTNTRPFGRFLQTSFLFLLCPILLVFLCLFLHQREATLTIDINFPRSGPSKKKTAAARFFSKVAK